MVIWRKGLTGDDLLAGGQDCMDAVCPPNSPEHLPMVVSVESGETILPARFGPFTGALSGEFREKYLSNALGYFPMTKSGIVVLWLLGVNGENGISAWAGRFEDFPQ